MVSILGVTVLELILLSNSVSAVTGKVTGNSVRIREKASSSSEVISLATKGEEVNVIGEEDGWYKIEFEDVTGYISTSYIDTDYKNDATSSNSSNENNTTPEENTQNNNSENNQNNENSQSNNSENNQNNENSQNNNPENNQNNENSQSNNPENNQNTSNISLGSNVKIENEANVRSLPNFSSRITSSIAKNTEVTVVDELNNWVKVTDGNINGWCLKVEVLGESTGTIPTSATVSSDNNKPENNTSDNKPESNTSDNNPENNNTSESKIQKGYVNVDRAVIREKPDGEFVDVIEDGDEVEVIGEEDGWYKINSGNYKGYYIAKRLITIK